jgi:large conductance mechanosensitive channel
MKNKKIVDIKRVRKELKYELESIFGKQNIKDFKEFAFKGHMVQMAIAFMLGAASKEVIKSLSQNIIMPFINFVVSQTGEDWRAMTHEPYEGIVLETGLFMSAFVDFTLMALIFFIGYKKFIEPLVKASEEKKHEIKMIDTIECKYCFSEVYYESAVCKYCTRNLNNPYAKVKDESRREN